MNKIATSNDRLPPTVKQFCTAEGARLGLGISAVSGRLARGGYPGYRLHRVNARVVFVLAPGVPVPKVSARELSVRRHVCDCGEVATERSHSEWVCARCLRLGGMNFDGPTEHNPLVKYAQRFAMPSQICRSRRPTSTDFL